VAKAKVRRSNDKQLVIDFIDSLDLIFTLLKRGAENEKTDIYIDFGDISDPSRNQFRKW
jgi:hypothetical protein